MKEPIIQNLFPTPIYMTNIDRPFTKQELKFVEKQKNHCTKNEGNVNTKDNYILNRKEFKNIKKFLDAACKDYLENYMS
jgi:ABC-type transporter lipoprotein component MlaA